MPVWASGFRPPDAAARLRQSCLFLQVQRHFQSQEEQAEAVCKPPNQEAILDGGRALGAHEGLHKGTFSPVLLHQGEACQNQIFFDSHSVGKHVAQSPPGFFLSSIAFGNVLHTPHTACAPACPPAAPPPPGGGGGGGGAWWVMRIGMGSVVHCLISSQTQEQSCCRLVCPGVISTLLLPS